MEKESKLALLQKMKMQLEKKKKKLQEIENVDIKNRQQVFDKKFTQKFSSFQSEFTNNEQEFLSVKLRTSRSSKNLRTRKKSNKDSLEFEANHQPTNISTKSSKAITTSKETHEEVISFFNGRSNEEGKEPQRRSSQRIRAQKDCTKSYTSVKPKNSQISKIFKNLKKTSKTYENKMLKYTFSDFIPFSLPHEKDDDFGLLLKNKEKEKIPNKEKIMAICSLKSIKSETQDPMSRSHKFLILSMNNHLLKITLSHPFSEQSFHFKNLHSKIQSAAFVNLFQDIFLLLLINHRNKENNSINNKNNNKKDNKYSNNDNSEEKNVEIIEKRFNKKEIYRDENNGDENDKIVSQSIFIVDLCCGQHNNTMQYNNNITQQHISNITSLQQNVIKSNQKQQQNNQQYNIKDNTTNLKNTPLPSNHHHLNPHHLNNHHYHYHLNLSYLLSHICPIEESSTVCLFAQKHLILWHTVRQRVIQEMALCNSFTPTQQYITKHKGLLLIGGKNGLNNKVILVINPCTSQCKLIPV